MGTETLSGQELIERAGIPRTYALWDITAPVGVGGEPFATSILLVSEPQDVAVDWTVGFSFLGTNIQRSDAPIGVGVMLGIESNFWNAMEPFVGINGYMGIWPTGVFGVEPEVGYRVNLADLLVAELAVGDLLVTGLDTTTGEYPRNHTASGLVVSAKVGMSLGNGS
jgi:hypothetical protein